MIVPVALVGLALFVLAFVGVNKLGPTIIGLAAVIGMIFGVYFIWRGFIGSHEDTLMWGSFLLLASGGVLVYLKTISSD